MCFFVLLIDKEPVQSKEKVQSSRDGAAPTAPSREERAQAIADLPLVRHSLTMSVLWTLICNKSKTTKGKKRGGGGGGKRGGGGGGKRGGEKKKKKDTDTYPKTRNDISILCFLPSKHHT